MEWMAHDGMHYGHLRVIDHPLHLTMEIEFLKRPAGDGWQVRVIGVLEPADPSQDRHPVHLVVYMLNDDEQEPVDLLIPSGGGIWKKADLSSPRLRTQMWNYDHTKVAVELRVREDYSPLASPKPWEIFSLHSAGGDTQEATSPFAFSALDMVGGRVRDRVDPITRKRRTSTTKDPQGSQWCDLRSLDCDNLKVSNSGEQDYYCIWKGGDSSGSREVPPEFSGNLVVMRRAYAADFRVELELAPADSFPTHPPSACRTTNVFRRREKKVKNYQTKFMRKGITSNEGKGPSGSFSHRLSTLAMSELLGSLGYYEGRYVSPTYLNESTSIKESYADDSRHFVFAFVGSRIEEPYGRVDITGLHLPFLVRYNKELAKGILHSWLSGSQDSRSGFVPSRTGFNAYVRSFMPKDLQWEETRLGSPPSILVGLTELLREMRRRHMQREGSDARLDDEVESDFAFLSELLPHLKGWRSWWHREQCGGSTDDLAKDCEHSKDRRSLEEWPRKPTGDPADQLGYRWRGRAGVSSLPTSGLDDYPRPVCAGHEHRELHVDLFSWIAYLSRIISTIEMEFLQREESVHVDWEAHLEALHWDEAQNRYSDRVGCPSNDTASASPPPFSPYVGYVNLYPVALGVSRRRIGPIFATMDLAKRQLSRSGRGLQSLSYSSVRLMREEGISHRNTFTGPIWPQHNLIYVYALATMYGPRKDRGWYEEEVVDERDSNDISWKDLQRVAGEEYSRLRDEMLPSLFQVSRWYECFSPITNAGLGSTTYIGSRALILPFLLDFT